MGNLSTYAAQLLQRAPPARAFHDSVVLKDKLFVWGGETDTFGQYHSHLNLFSVDMQTGSWHQHTVTPPDAPPPSKEGCSTVIGNTIYSYGGKISQSPYRASDELYKLNLKDMRWRRVLVRGIKPGGRMGAGMCSVNGKLLLMGGYGPLPSERIHPQAEYKIGRIGSGCGWNNELFEFDPGTSCWSPVCVTGSKPCPRAGHTLTAVDEKRTILFGGFDGEKHLNDVWLFDGERKVWSHTSPSSSPWPQSRSLHTVCTMVCDNQEITVLLLGGSGDDGVLSDCWLLDVMRGIGKVMHCGETFSRFGHSAGCVTLSDGTVVVGVFGGNTANFSSSVIGNPCFYQWNPHRPSVLHSGIAPARTPLRVCDQPPLVSATSPPASGTSEEMRQLREEVSCSAAIIEQQQGQLGQMDAQLMQERIRADGLEVEKQEADWARAVAESTVDLDLEMLLRQIRELSAINNRLTITNEQLTMEVKNRDGLIDELIEDGLSLQQQVNRLTEETRSKETQLHCNQRTIDTLHNEAEERQREIDRISEEKGQLEQEIDEMEQLLRNAEIASEEAERRLTDNEEVLRIPSQDVHLSDKELGSGSFGVVLVGYWRGSPVAVKTLHKELAKEHYQRRLFEQEVSVCSRLHHPNIAAICGVIQQRDAPFSLIMELLQASLADVIEAAHVSGRYLTLREQTDVSHDCLSGLTYLHDLPHSVLHGDIRPTNILITSVMQAKLGDLGAARFTDCSLSVGPMSPLYVAPERLADRTLPNSKEADVYSMGVSLGELFTGNQMDRKDRPMQLRSVRQRDLRLVCIKMAGESGGERMMASVALTVSDRVVKTDDYSRCGPRRMVKGVIDGVEKVTLCEKPW